MIKYTLYISFLILPFLVSCGDPESDKPHDDTGRVSIQFHHRYDNENVMFDTLQYINEAGNQILFSEIQYFISDVRLHYHGGSTYLIDKWKDIHYVDSDIPSTQVWDVYDSIPAGHIDSISFTFGINEEKNQSYMYVNPPESLMFWPDILGGGYHYLKLNGKWLTGDELLSPFNFHLGIGQVYDTSGLITGFIQNHFRGSVSLPIYSSYILNITPGETLAFAMVMNLESWFETPMTFDFNVWGGDIMQNQDAMHAGCRNGIDVFTLDVPLSIQ